MDTSKAAVAALRQYQSNTMINRVLAGELGCGRDWPIQVRVTLQQQVGDRVVDMGPLTARRAYQIVELLRKLAAGRRPPQDVVWRGTRTAWPVYLHFGFSCPGLSVTTLSDDDFLYSASRTHAPIKQGDKSIAREFARSRKDVGFLHRLTVSAGVDVVDVNHLGNSLAHREEEHVVLPARKDAPPAQSVWLVPTHVHTKSRTIEWRVQVGLTAKG